MKKKNYEPFCLVLFLFTCMTLWTKTEKKSVNYIQPTNKFKFKKCMKPVDM